MVRTLAARIANRLTDERDYWRSRAASRALIAQLPARWSTSADYDEYLLAQLARTHRYRQHVAHGRVQRLVDAFLRVTPAPVREQAVLCVGCRNRHELDVFARAGFGDVKGIDLLPEPPDILLMDMHCLTFSAARFDVIFACHALEHAFDVDGVLREWQRVARPGAVCVVEVPIRYEKWRGREDLHDFKSADGLIAACHSIVGEILLAEEPTDGTARAIFTLRPAA